MEKLDRVRSPPRLGPPVILILLMFMMALLSTPITPTNGQSPASSASCRTCSRRSEVKVAMVSHGTKRGPELIIILARCDAYDSLTIARKGIERANALFNVSAVPMNPDVFDFAAIANLVNKAAENYSLLGSTVVDGVTIGAALRSAVDKGKSVISFNSGDSVLNNTKVHSHIGQPEYIAGYRTGVAFARAGRSNLLCIQHETGNAGLVARCNGLLDGLKSINNAGTMAMVAMDGNSASALSASLSNYLTNQQSTDGIVSLNTEVTKVVVQEVESRNRLSSISIAGFDLSNDVFTFIQQGKMVFAVDQQEFLQAFATIQQLKVLHMTRGMRALNQLLLSGPNMVTSANVQRKLCQANPNRPGCTAVNPSSLTIGVVSTSSWGSPDAFTQQAKYGVQAALKEFGTKLRYLDTNIFDLAGLVSQVQAAISSGEVNALVMPIPSTAANHNFTTLVAKLQQPTFQ
ncbi:periplasmic binding protein-like I [Catenaria anguillulae PL171]|uniref:Periplasmic binding protein-like I n=1 Tax=Catenaria anguillulae PL171 TaxID=765915 RepID=A0A1Y2HPU9_9FUNG|nr:periplasmic binding protein-like I [Catenaria anguillulae PL171]